MANFDEDYYGLGLNCSPKVSCSEVRFLEGHWIMRVLYSSVYYSMNELTADYAFQGSAWLDKSQMQGSAFSRWAWGMTWKS